jgi:hypothetical protein
MMNADCFQWEGLMQGLKMAQRMKAFPQADDIDEKLDELAHAIMADARRVNAVRQDCPKRFAEIEQRISQPGVQPFGDPSTFAKRAQLLNAEILDQLQAAVEGEKHRRTGEAGGRNADR